MYHHFPQPLLPPPSGPPTRRLLILSSFIYHFLQHFILVQFVFELRCMDSLFLCSSAYWIYFDLFDGYGLIACSYRLIYFLIAPQISCLCLRFLCSYLPHAFLLSFFLTILINAKRRKYCMIALFVFDTCIVIEFHIRCTN